MSSCASADPEKLKESEGNIFFEELKKSCNSKNYEEIFLSNDKVIFYMIREEDNKVVGIFNLMKKNNRYYINFITNMDSSEKYATVLGLSQVKEDNFRIVRDFIKLLGSEFLTTFDNIWARNDINRLEMIASERLTKSMK